MTSDRGDAPADAQPLAIEDPAVLAGAATVVRAALARRATREA